MLLSLLLAACSPDSGSKDSGDAPDPVPADVVIEASLVNQSPTTVVVRWDLGDQQVDAVVVRATSDAGDSLERSYAPDYSPAILWAFHPEAEVLVEVELQVGDERQVETLPPLRTGAPPPELPAMVVTGEDPFPGELLLTTFVINHPAAVLLDGDGTVRWWRMVPELIELSRVRLGPDGRTLYGVAANPHANADPSLVAIPLEGGTATALPLEGAHHDLVVHDDGTLATLVHDARVVDGIEQIADRIVELSHDGTQREVFDAWDVWTPPPMPPVGLGFTHGNALRYDAERDDYLASFFTLNAICRIDRATGELVWELGTPGGDDFMTPAGPDYILQGTHGMQVLDGGLLYFENGPADRGLSRAVEIRIDEEAHLVEPVWSYENPDLLYTMSLGDVERLPDGNTLVDYSTNGRLELVTPEGERLWMLETEIGGVLGYFERIADPMGG